MLKRMMTISAHPKRGIEMKRNGFTLIELLVVIAILSILITLGSKGLRSARVSAKKAQAMIEMQSIETAIKSYFNKYGKLPAESADQGAPDPEPNEAFSLAVIEILTAINSTDNPAQLVFLDAQIASATSTDNAFRDPWGVPYIIVLDTDYDGVFDYGGETIRRKAGVISIGLHNLTTTDSDILKSWK
jgi:prepilin-type N-terminal cleavage/methylation domain-containing protein